MTEQTLKPKEFFCRNCKCFTIPLTKEHPLYKGTGDDMECNNCHLPYINENNMNDIRTILYKDLYELKKKAHALPFIKNANIYLEKECDKLRQNNTALKDALRELLPYIDTNDGNNQAAELIKKVEGLLK